MTDPSKKNNRVKPNQLSNLVKSCVESNDRNYRLQIPKTSDKSRDYQTNSSQEHKQRYMHDEKLFPKPLLDCLQPGPLLTSKPYEKSISQRRRRNKPFDQQNLERSNDDQVNPPEISPRKNEIGRSTIDIREPTSEHLFALKTAFENVLSKRFLSDESLQHRSFVFKKLRQIIIEAKPDCHVTLFGSVYFECCLEKPGVLDIDVQFKEVLQYDTIKELLEIIHKSDLYKEAVIDTEYKPSCINLITNEPNMRVRITSGFNRGINLSKLIRIYTRFDPRVVILLRLFRVLAKTCNIDKPELGTLHPTVFHVMIIHFLQQLDQPVIPCLHEYAYGVDHVPLTLNDSQYPEFFHVCEKYSQQWKSNNKSDVSILFLQLLSYYVKTFNSKQFVVSIQTRMPVMKIDKNWHSRKLLIEDPTDIKRSLGQTMQSMRSIDYFRDTLNAALNYFGRKQKKTKKNISNKCTIENDDEDLVEVVNDDDDDDENDAPTIERTNLLHNSYRLFYKRLPPTVARDMNIKQGRVREYYRHTFDNQKNICPKGIIQLNSTTTKFDELDENALEEVLQHGLEENFQIVDDNQEDLLETTDFNEEDEEQIDIEQKLPTRELFPIGDEEQQSTENEIPTTVKDIEQEDVINDAVKETNENVLLPVEETFTSDILVLDELIIQSIESSSTSPPVDVKLDETIIDDVSDQTPSPLSSPIKLEPMVVNEPSTTEKDSSEFYYDFQPENFHAEQGAPYVCTTCNGVGHLKSECPELVVPNVIALPSIDDKWINILSKLCRQVTDRCKPKKTDIDNRERILSQLEEQFRRDYPDCHLYAFGSFYNGFGFQQSDLDVCLVFKDEREHSSEEIIRILQRILRAMKSTHAFEDVQPILHAKVPIIRSRHRQLNIEIDISLHNMLAIENTKLLKTYTDIDPRVSELGYMIKHLAKFCGIGDASRGTLSSYAYIIMLIHFLQQVQPPVLPVLQKLSDDPTKKNSMYKKCSKWNVYFYGNLPKIKEMWKMENNLSSGALWIEFLRFYTEQFHYDEHVVTIRQSEPLLKHEKGWFRQTIAIEDPFELSHNLAGGLSLRNWTIIRRVFIRARQQFGVQHEDINLAKLDMKMIEDLLFNIDDLCPTNAPKRCEWCHGPYHIRKRCPALATLANERQKKVREMNNSEQQWEADNYFQMSTYYPENSNRHANRNHSFNTNGWNYPRSAPTNRPPFRYSNQNVPREFPPTNSYPDEQQQQQQLNNSHRNLSTKSCFKCGELGHIRSKCPTLAKINPIHQQKSSS